MSTTQKKSRGTGVDLLHGSILPSLILFAIPIVGSSLFQLLYNTVDTMIVGRFLGERSLAAIGAASPIYMFIVCWAVGMGNGIAIVIARSFGMGDEERLKRSVASALMITLVVSLFLTLISRVILHPLFVLLNTPESIIAESQSYTSTICLFILVTMCYNLASGIMRAVGNSVMPLVFLIISSLTNIVLDLLFVAVFGMGIQGAAIATVIAQLLSAVCCLVYVLRRMPLLIPQKKHFETIDWELTLEMFTQGLSMGTMSALVDVGTIVLQYGINGMGEYIIAGHTIARKVFQMFSMWYVAMGQSLSTFSSQNMGAGQVKRIRRALREAGIFNFCLTVFFTILLFFAARPLVQLLSGSANEELLSNGTLYMRITAPFFFVLGEVFNYRFSLQGMGMKILPLISSLIEMVGKILFVVFLIPVYQYKAVIFCEPLIWCFMAVSLLIAFYTRKMIIGERKS